MQDFFRRAFVACWIVFGLLIIGLALSQHPWHIDTVAVVGYSLMYLAVDTVLAGLGAMFCCVVLETD